MIGAADFCLFALFFLFSGRWIGLLCEEVSVGHAKHGGILFVVDQRR